MTGILEYPLRDGSVDHWLWSLSPEQAEIGWHYARCPEDHVLTLVDAESCGCRPVRAAAVTRLHTTTGGAAMLRLTGVGIECVSVNGERIGSEAFPGALATPVQLLPGESEIRIDFAIPLGRGAVIMRAALQVCDGPEDLVVHLPFQGGDPARRAKFERVFEGAAIDRDVYTAGSMVQVTWPALDERCTTQGRLQHSSGRIYGQSTKMLDAETRTLVLGKALNVPDGAYQILVMPDSEEYYGGIGYSRALPVRISTSAFSETWYGDLAARRAEALDHAAGFRSHLFGQIARMALGRWSEIDVQAIADSVERIISDCPASRREAVSLLGAAARYGEQMPVEGRAAVETLQRHLLAVGSGEACEDSDGYDDGDELLRLTAALLVAQMTQSPGQSTLETEIAHWLHARGVAGLCRWDSPGTLESLMVALTHLVDLSGSETVSELSAVLLDKLLFGLATNTFKGAWGSARKSGSLPDIVNGRLDATAGICRLLWGMGVFNDHLAGVVALSVSESYEVPSLIQAVALDLSEPLWSRESQRMRGEAVSKVTYRTDTFMLSSAQAYRAGAPGQAEQIWQATLGPDAVVFANHPAYASDQAAPGFWCGNAVLPRVAQWHDALIAVYHSADAGMDFTHAYFPIWAFDEYALSERWAFARVGGAYLALGSTNGLSLMTAGVGAGRELRSPGRTTFWLCQPGSAEQDGDFAAFQSAIRARPIDAHGLSVDWTTIRGDRLQFGWEGDFQVNGEVMPLEFEQHIENRYCASGVQQDGLDIQVKTFVMRLNFELE